MHRVDHLMNMHKDDLRDVARYWNSPEHENTESVENMLSVYNEAIAVKVRKGAPLASYAIDRRCIHAYTDAAKEGSIESLICLCCARRFPWMASRSKNTITWTKPYTAVDQPVKSGSSASAEANGRNHEHRSSRNKLHELWV